jgi:hypothetical protein
MPLGSRLSGNPNPLCEGNVAGKRCHMFKWRANMHAALVAKTRGADRDLSIIIYRIQSFDDFLAEYPRLKKETKR